MVLISRQCHNTYMAMHNDSSVSSLPASLEISLHLLSDPCFQVIPLDNSCFFVSLNIQICVWDEIQVKTWVRQGLGSRNLNVAVQHLGNPMIIVGPRRCSWSCCFSFFPGTWNEKQIADISQGEKWCDPQILELYLAVIKMIWWKGRRRKSINSFSHFWGCLVLLRAPEETGIKITCFLNDFN